MKKYNNYSLLSTFLKNLENSLDIRLKPGSVPPMFKKYYIKSRLGGLVSEIAQYNCCGSMGLETAPKSLSFYKSLKGSESSTHIIKDSTKSASLVTLRKQGMFLKNEFRVEGESTK